ncbi:hypothetical protein F66182_6469 [Fusarium sp. NRRL 66182]|nr:hypothetical protein F66182_6469 [Fusarium sp. NRRL 66182]
MKSILPLFAFGASSALAAPLKPAVVVRVEVDGLHEPVAKDHHGKGAEYTFVAVPKEGGDKQFAPKDTPKHDYTKHTPKEHTYSKDAYSKDTPKHTYTKDTPKHDYTKFIPNEYNYSKDTPKHATKEHGADVNTHSGHDGSVGKEGHLPTKEYYHHRTYSFGIDKNGYEKNHNPNATRATSWGNLFKRCKEMPESAHDLLDKKLDNEGVTGELDRQGHKGFDGHLYDGKVRDPHDHIPEDHDIPEPDYTYHAPVDSEQGHHYGNQHSEPGIGGSSYGQNGAMQRNGLLGHLNGDEGILHGVQDLHLHGVQGNLHDVHGYRNANKAPGPYNNNIHRGHGHNAINKQHHSGGRDVVASHYHDEHSSANPFE